jgi:hypothetical protein
MARHSTSGILKANWSYSEYHKMLSRSLTFTAQGADLIRAGLESYPHSSVRVCGRNILSKHPSN